jgi:hypothetical protein
MVLYKAVGRVDGTEAVVRVVTVHMPYPGDNSSEPVERVVYSTEALGHVVTVQKPWVGW